MAETLVAGRYRLDSLLGRGGMSEVWAATDLELGRRVALKLLAPNEDNARFEREARAVAALGHPNVTQLYDYGESDGRPFMVLEYLSGGSLEDLLREGMLADGDARRIAAEIAAGLSHAHARGVVHRDLKPSNVLFDEEGRAKLSDFGIARMVAGEGTLTEAGTVLGTAAYISPEQAMGLPATAASDVYSFGVLLFRMLTGRLPFESEDPIALVVAHRDSPPPLVTDLRADAPPALAALTAATLAKDPALRPPDGAALVDALDGGEVPAAVTRVMPAVGAPVRRRSPLRPLLLALLVILLALAGALVAYAVTRSDDAATPPATLPGVSVSRKHHARTTTKRSTTGTTTPTTTTAPTTSTTAPTTTRRLPTTTRRVTPPPPPPPATTTLAFTTTAVPTTTTAPDTTTADTTTDTTSVTDTGG
jgi:eukaryotic-like serine/threonine-protein kinase